MQLPQLRMHREGRAQCNLLRHPRIDYAAASRSGAMQQPHRPMGYHQSAMPTHTARRLGGPNCKRNFGGGRPQPPHYLAFRSAGGSVRSRRTLGRRPAQSGDAITHLAAISRAFLPPPPSKLTWRESATPTPSTWQITLSANKSEYLSAPGHDAGVSSPPHQP
mmetsp:Transcript_19651/g.36796  ORF Transcript_19651/g.36796 Transcript_19651/m.36796 type:complete len:163 (-) Transcript_19651:4076-4564(-)